MNIQVWGKIFNKNVKMCSEQNIDLCEISENR